ncbi:uncharacterized protein LOC136025301 isoform X2 [Artemia franciscana]|nr:hypothetical protein QYM36_011669 [Artemia franciscana]KAK2713045.1 hypothetical protein QYM36_011669 [Artemia franciscana]KAK2713046.1 hypothetical protein QYM36_011669 [Artemia franciscana]
MEDLPFSATRREDDIIEPDRERNKQQWYSRKSYFGAVCFNIATYLIPAIYSTLSKLWIAKINADSVATTDAYTYMGVIVEIWNEGLPRASYLVIGDVTLPGNVRLNALHTLIGFQAMGGLILSLLFLILAPHFANTFVPEETVIQSINYIRISSFSTFFNVIDFTLGIGLRALDRPDVPLVISLSKTVANIVLDFLFLSTFRVTESVNVETQAATRLVCDFCGSVAGITYYFTTVKLKPKLKVASLKSLIVPGMYTFAETLLRNGLYLWLVAGIVSLGANYATAWGVFNTIRWGAVMVLTNALYDAACAFTGHQWSVSKPKDDRSCLTWNDVMHITKYSRASAAIALIFEIILAITFSFWLVEPFAYFLSESLEVAALVKMMWISIDWTYILFSISTQLSAILLSTLPVFFFIKSLLGNLLWVLPWSIALSTLSISAEEAWQYYAIIFGGSLVIGFIMQLISLGGWVYFNMKRKQFGKILQRFRISIFD